MLHVQISEKRAEGRVCDEGIGVQDEQGSAQPLHDVLDRLVDPANGHTLTLLPSDCLIFHSEGALQMVKLGP